MSRCALNERMVMTNKDRVGKIALDEDGDEIENSIVLSTYKIASFENNKIYITKFSAFTFEENTTVFSIESLEMMNKLVRGE